MTDFYVRTDGNDGNTGTGPAAADAWLTIGKALGAAGISSGDAVYIAPGVYREVVTVAMTSAVAETQVIGDVTASQFSDLDGGIVRFTAYTTNDTTAPSGTTLLTMSSRDHLTFEDIWFQGGVNSTTNIVAITTSENLTFRRCLFTPGRQNPAASIDIVCAVDTAANIAFDSCIMRWNTASGSGIQVTVPTSASADYDIELSVVNCLLTNLTSSGDHVVIFATGAGAFEGGGVKVRNSTFLGASRALRAFNAGVSSTAGSQCEFYNNYVENVSAGVSANTSGQIVEDYNLFQCPGANTNVTLGANSVVENNTYPHAQMFEFGQSGLWGMVQRPPMEPYAGWGGLGWGNDASGADDDLRGRPRPSGTLSGDKSIGALERGNTFGKETGTVRTGTVAISIAGPGVQDFELPVDDTSTTATVYVQWDGNYTGTKPQMIVLNGEECGVATATDTATGSSGAWEQLSLTFTPSRIGIVTIRFQSNDTNGIGEMYVDDFAVN